MSEIRISCVGIIGDGCGGGREFIVENGLLYAHDPETKENYLLLEGIEGAKSISKKACLIMIECEDEEIVFDLSTLKKL